MREHANSKFPDFRLRNPFFIDGPNTRKWSGRVANGLHLLTQGQLIVFELNDQMCVRGGGGFEGFF